MKKFWYFFIQNDIINQIDFFKIYMPLIQTIQLIKKFGSQILDGTIEDEELEFLMQDCERRDGNFFKEEPSTQANYKYWWLNQHSNFRREWITCHKTAGIVDFVITIGARLSEENIHKLVKKCIYLSRHFNHVFSDGKFEHVLLAYEMVHYPKNAVKHFETKIIQDKFFRKSSLNQKEFEEKNRELIKCLFVKLIDFYINQAHHLWGDMGNEKKQAMKILEQLAEGISTEKELEKKYVLDFIENLTYHMKNIAKEEEILKTRYYEQKFITLISELKKTINDNELKLRPYLEKQVIKLIERIEYTKEQYHYPVSHLNKMIKKILYLINNVEEINENKIKKLLEENKNFENYEKRKKRSIYNLFSETPLSTLIRDMIVTIEAPFEDQKYQSLINFTKKTGLLKNSIIENMIHQLIMQIEKSNLPISQRINILDATVKLIEMRNEDDVHKYIMKYKNFAEELSLSTNNSIWCCMFSSSIEYTNTMKEIAKKISVEFGEKNIKSHCDMIEIKYN